MSDAAGEPQRFFFVHCQKAAGTSLLKRLHLQFLPEAIYPDASDGKAPEAQIVYADLAARYKVRRDEIRVITGHFPFGVAELLGDPFTKFTVLRDPVERTLSYLRHHSVVHPGDKDLSFEELYFDDFRFVGMIHNHQTKMFSLTPQDILDGAEATFLTRVTFTPEHLERAKRNLRTVEAVGVQDDFEPFCDDLARRFDWNLGNPIRANFTKPSPFEVPQSFLRKIAEDNAYDMELYELARELWAEQHRQL